MKAIIIVASLMLMLAACDSTRIYEVNKDFPDPEWIVSDKPSFEFKIDNTDLKYNLFVNVRNEISYPKANLYFTYYLMDSAGTVLEKDLITKFLFDKKTGEPEGSSVLGDIYDHQFLLLKDFQFQYPGKYTVQYEQFMRMDTLDGVLALGLRVEKVKAKKSDD